MATKNRRSWGKSATDQAIAKQLGTQAGLTPIAGKANSIDLEKDFVWSPTSLKAAELLAENELSMAEVAEACKTSRQSLWAWKQHPQFAEAVADRANDVVAAMHRHFIAKKHKRIATLDRLHQKALAIIEARSTDPRHTAWAGGETGLLVVRTKTQGLGRNATTWTEVEFDRALVAEIRAIEEQAARELGQWIEKSEVSGKFSFTDLFAMVEKDTTLDAEFREVVNLDDVREQLEASNGD